MTNAFPAEENKARRWPAIRKVCYSDLTQVIAELIWECPFLSCKILCRYHRVSQETCLRILHEKLGFKKFHLRWVPHQLIPNRTWKPQELPSHINFLKYSNIAKQQTLSISWARTSHGSFWSIPIMVSRPRPEIRCEKHSWQKLALKGAWFWSFGPFLESTVYLHWPKIWNTNTILSTYINMSFRIFSKKSAHRVVEKHWSIFSCILTI
jgi:hypothetical protein